MLHVTTPHFPPTIEHLLQLSPTTRGQDHPFYSSYKAWGFAKNIQNDWVQEKHAPYKWHGLEHQNALFWAVIL